MENFFPEILIQYLLPFRQAFSKPGLWIFSGIHRSAAAFSRAQVHLSYRQYLLFHR